jgi:hypothetical protein
MMRPPAGPGPLLLAECSSIADSMPIQMPIQMPVALVQQPFYLLFVPEPSSVPRLAT